MAEVFRALPLSSIEAFYLSPGMLEWIREERELHRIFKIIHEKLLLKLARAISGLDLKDLYQMDPILLQKCIEHHEIFKIVHEKLLLEKARAISDLDLKDIYQMDPILLQKAYLDPLRSLTNHKAPSPEESASACKTCTSGVGHQRAIYVDTKNDMPVIWSPNTILHYFVDVESFGNFTRRAKHTAICFYISAERFNRAKVLPSGVTAVRPQFRPVLHKAQADFVLKYRKTDDADGSVAEAFFPRDDPQDRKVRIFPCAFEDPSRFYLDQIFDHEIMHIHGVRHPWAPKEDKRDGTSSEWVGIDDPDTCMAYHHPSKIDLKFTDVFGLDLLYNQHPSTVTHVTTKSRATRDTGTEGCEIEDIFLDW